ncbi:hypothetical protein [Streptomyces prasinopilosus]|uniref:GHMP family kinase ATP-binding protein n=1 Tax=Streptomyces prasinopilosus TaxID=67344 RepID=UPI001C2F4E1D|nr:hypothetical protein [Streptomyces prasinopilosus]
MSSAPLRVSLAGGGTDLPSYASRFGGTVLGAAIDLRVTVVGRDRPAGALPGTGPRVCLDSCGYPDGTDQVANPFAREALRRHARDGDLDLVSFGDVPGGTGLGSSAAFCVALTAGLVGPGAPGAALAEAAGDIEMTGLGRPVGRQDHYLAALGGFRLLHFGRDGTVEVEEIHVDTGTRRRLDDELLLFFTGTVRDTGTVLADQHTRVSRGDADTERRLHEIKELTTSALTALRGGDVAELGQLLGRHWELKRGLGSRVTLPGIDRAYRTAMAAGATGGKLLGAGGGGFLLLHADARSRPHVRSAMAESGFIEQPFHFDTAGASLTLLPSATN